MSHERSITYLVPSRSSRTHFNTRSEFLHLNKKDEVFEGCVEVGLLLQPHDRVEMLVVDVGIDPEQALQNRLGHRHEVTLEGDALETTTNTNK